MKTLIQGFVLLFLEAAAFGQGAVYFNNIVPGAVDARVLLPDGSGVGAGWTAQLYVGAEGTALRDFKAAMPRTTFRMTSSQTLGYVNPVDVTVPDLAPGATATVVMRAFNGATYETSLMRGESPPITITVGGSVFPPANLTGLNGFTVRPNPNTVTVTASAGANGSVTPASVTKLIGDEQIFFATPDANYSVNQWFVDGNLAQSGGATLTIRDLRSNHSVFLTFQILSPAGGTLVFNNLVVGQVDARVTYPDGTGVGAGWRAQLYGGPENTPVAALQAILPPTLFRTNSVEALGYLIPVDVSVPGVAPNARATLVMRVYQGSSFEASAFRGESAPFTVTLGGGLFPPESLIGLQPFQVNGPHYFVSVSAGTNGSVSPAGTVTKFQGESQTFTALPAANYAVDEWTVNGQVAQTGGTTFTLSNIQANATVAVSFKSAFLDGAVVFNNLIPGAVDARVLLPNGTGAGAGWTAQLYGGPAGTATAELKPLYPTTTFRTSSAATLGYVNAVDVSVPHVPPSTKATLVMRVYNGFTLETSTLYGESAPVTVTLGGGLLPPANLTGLQGFTLPSAPPAPAGAGLVNFDNYVEGVVNARVQFADGTGVGAGWATQLYGGPVGGPLLPLQPVTTFQTTSPDVLGYVEPVVVALPALAPGADAMLVMAAFNGSSFDSSTMIGRSEPVIVRLGGGDRPPANLVGLEGFTVTTRFPTIVTQPVSRTVLEGYGTTFSVTATGAEPLFYQWFFNGNRIAGATDASYSISNARSSDAGTYFVAVANSAGTVISAEATLTVVSPGTRGDFNGDGFADLLFQTDDGYLGIWMMNGAEMIAASFLEPNHLTDQKWRIVGTGRFNSDAQEDLLFQHEQGTLAVWQMEGLKLASAAYLVPNAPASKSWSVAGTGDFNKDGQIDLLFQHEDGMLAVWYMDGLKLTSAVFLDPKSTGDEDWRVAGTGDFNSDGKVDLLFQHEDGTLAVWYMNGAKLAAGAFLVPRQVQDRNWRVASVGDFNRDGKPDLVFQHRGDSALAVWFLDGIKLTSGKLLNPTRPGGSWKVVAP